MKKSLFILLSMLYLLVSFEVTAFAATLRVGENQQFKTVQEAVMASNDFDTILIEPGIYRSDHTIQITGRQGLVIEGAGSDKVHLVITDLIAAVIGVERSSGIRIAGVNAYHDPQADYSPCAGAVIQLSYSNNTTIIDNELNGCGSIGVSAYDSQQVNVIHNNIHHNSYAGLNFYRSTGLVQGNTIANNTQTVSGQPNGVIFKNNNIGRAGYNLALDMEDFTLMGIRLGDPLSTVTQKMGAPAKKSQTQEGMSYDYGSIEVIISQQNTVINLLTDDKTVATQRGMKPGSTVSEITAAYGGNYLKQPFGNLDLYEYTFTSNPNNKYVLRFAVNQDTGTVNYIGCRAASALEAMGTTGQ